MKTEFQTKWHKAREERGSNIIAGLDPALFEIGRGDKGLPQEANLLDWSVAFIDAVEPYVAGIKLNQAFFQGVGQRGIQEQIIHKIHNLNLLALSDNKIADIGNTNDTWIYYNEKLGFDMTTCAPYAGNIEAVIEAAHERGIGMMPMGLMSNPEYRTEMNYTNPETGEALWKSRTRRSMEADADGVAVGGTYTKNDPEFVEFVELTNDSEMLYLIPGIGAQGGKVEDFLVSGIKPDKCMINSGRGVMFPNGSDSTPKEQGESAKQLRDSFNKVAYGN